MTAHDSAEAALFPLTAALNAVLTGDGVTLKIETAPSTFGGIHPLPGTRIKFTVPLTVTVYGKVE